MKLKKHIECGNNWSVEFSKPHKLTLQVSIFKKTNKDGLDGSYWWSQYFDLKDMKNGIPKLYVNEMKKNYNNHGSIRDYIPKAKPKKYDGPKFNRYDYQISREQLINYLVIQDRKLRKQKHFINLLENIDFMLRNSGT